MPLDRTTGRERNLKALATRRVRRVVGERLIVVGRFAYVPTYTSPLHPSRYIRAWGEMIRPIQGEDAFATRTRGYPSRLWVRSFVS